MVAAARRHKRPPTTRRPRYCVPSSPQLGYLPTAFSPDPIFAMAKHAPFITLRLSIKDLIIFSAVFLLLTSLFFSALISTPQQRLQSARHALSTLPSHSFLASNSTSVSTTLTHQSRLRLLADLPQCAHKQTRAKSFLMLFMGHSGSTAIMTSLRQHSQTHILGLEPVDHGIFRNDTNKKNALRAVKFTEQFFLNGTKTSLTPGFKIRPLHISNAPRRFTQLVRRFETRIVWSYRSNVLKQAIGDYGIFLGDRTAYEGIKIDANSTSSAVSPASSRSIYIDDMNRLHSFMKSRVAGDKQVSQALKAITPDNCVLPVSYESFLRDPQFTMLRIQTFLGLDVAEQHESLRAKANPDTLCDLVQNWQHVCEAFFGCVQWRWMLDDFENGCSCSTLQPSRFGRRFCSIK
ncbi:hypothetical protein BWQ96_02844 [Gracilariopsis chorda]|uniref:Uncharacterized protein n=1 Tax=Gracilariopsis chorda TaxID=448386 RepID=A0A2V3IYZ6_9FLOR|nr:hypothetical protein BWQ96_02844 [Gracilariopsis chorda]|eukprot:PXF47364.1 hypothetical protein BWQ96_02844 [Gracilariopsis chorda]